MESIETQQRPVMAEEIAAATAPGRSHWLAPAMVALAATWAVWHALDWLGAHPAWRSFRPWPPSWNGWPGTWVDLAWALLAAIPLVVGLALARRRSSALLRASALIFLGLMAESLLVIARQIAGTTYTTTGGAVVAGRFVLAMLDYLVAVRAWRAAAAGSSPTNEGAGVRGTALIGATAFVAILLGGVVASAYHEALGRVPWFQQLVFQAAHWLPLPLPQAMERARRFQEADFEFNQALALTGSGLDRDARDAYRRAAAIFQDDLAKEPKQKSLKSRLAQAQNNLAWLLVTCPDPALIEPAEAVRRSRQAVALEPGLGIYWNTVGVAEYRAGRLDEAARTLAHSMQLRDGGDAFDWFFLAMIAQEQGHHAQARSWFDRAVQWRESQRPFDPELLRFQAEAANRLGLPAPPPPHRQWSRPSGINPILRRKMRGSLPTGGFQRPPMTAPL
jgi:tetratricopeptide (TPR) repeat protein